MIIKEKGIWRNHRKNLKIEWRKRMNHREELENEWRYLRGFRYMRKKRTWTDLGIFEQCTGKIWIMRAEGWEWGITTWWPSEERNGNNSWNAPDGWKEFSQSKTIMRGWHQARTTNLEENGARFKRNSSSIFKCWEWRWETPPWIVEALQNEN